MSGTTVFHSLERAGSELEHPVVTIGNFDGVHLGHRAIFERTRDVADDRGAPAVAITFSPHPVRYFRPQTEPFRLTTDEAKFELILSEGIDAVVALEFDAELANLTPEEFVATVVDGAIGAQHVVVGANFAFGKDRAGSTDDLRRIAGSAGIGTDVLDEVDLDGEVISSTRIREALRDGDVSTAARLLGRNYRLLGEVEKGRGRGKELGYPTANIAPANLVPADGVYATYLYTPDHAPLPAATSIGTRPTFDDGERTVEAYVLDRDDLSLYGAPVELEFVEYLRPEKEFDSAEELVDQMEQDVAETRASLERAGTPPPSQ